MLDCLFVCLYRMATHAGKTPSHALRVEHGAALKLRALCSCTYLGRAGQGKPCADTCFVLFFFVFCERIVCIVCKEAMRVTYFAPAAMTQHLRRLHYALVSHRAWGSHFRKIKRCRSNAFNQHPRYAAMQIYDRV